MCILSGIFLDLPYEFPDRPSVSNSVADGSQDNIFFLGQAAKFLQVPWFPELFCKWSREFPEAPLIRYLNFGNSETLFVNCIEAYKQVLQTKSAYFVKPAFARQFAHEIIGDGLPFVEGKLHKLRRAAISRKLPVHEMLRNKADVQRTVLDTTTKILLSYCSSKG